MNLSKLKGLKNKKDGFTLIELLVVIIIIGILFVVLIPRLNFATDAAKLTGVKTDFHSMKLTMEQIVRTESQLPGGADIRNVVSKFNTYSDIKFTANEGAVAGWTDGDEFATSDVQTPFGGNYRLEISELDRIVGGQPMTTTLNLPISTTNALTISDGTNTWAFDTGVTPITSTADLITALDAVAAVGGLDFEASVVDGHLVLTVIGGPTDYNVGLVVNGNADVLAQLGLKAGMYSGYMKITAPNAPEADTGINFGAAGGNLSVSTVGLGNNLYQ